MKIKFKKLSTRIILPIVLLLSIPIIVNLTVVRKNLIDKEIELSKQYERNYAKSFHEQIEIYNKSALYAASICSELDFVKDAYKQYYGGISLDSAQYIISSNIQHINIKLKAATGLQAKIHFHLPTIQSFIRCWDGTGGDDLSSYRKTVATISKTHKEISGIEIGRAGLVSRGLSPIFDENHNYLGSVEVMFSVASISNNIDKKIKHALYVKNETFIKANNNNGLGAPSLYINGYSLVHNSAGFNKSTQNGLSFTTLLETSINNNTIVSSSPIFDFQNNLIAYLVLERDISEEITNANFSFLKFLALGTSVLSILILLVYLLVNKQLIMRINVIKDYIILLADGKQTNEITVKSDDEIGSVYYSLNKLRNKFSNLSMFAEEIGNGNENIELEDLSEEDLLSNSLMSMRDSIISAKQQENLRKREEDKRNWATQGYAEFGDLLRQNSENIDFLTNIIISSLVKYLKANQGAIFVINNEDENNIYLELEAAYAFERKKYTDRQIQLGEGLTGTCAIEKQSIYLTDIPNDYVSITSGLGDSNPKSVLIVPLKIEDDIFGVIELASFSEFEPYQIKFLEQVSENIASTLKSIKVARHTELLLKKSQQQAEELQSQEEEMRQNLEELQSTQEEMQRKQDEVLNTNKKTEAILATSQDGVLLVSKNNKTIDIANKTILDLTGYREEELIGEKYEKVLRFLKVDKIKAGDKKRQKVIKKDGGKILADIYIGEEKINNEVLFLFFIRDVGKIVELEQSIALDIEQSNRQKTQLKKQEEDLKMNIEEMAAQEEELRQNMEEMQTTQEELLQKQSLLNENKKQINAILDNSYEGITIIDRKSHEIEIVNKSFIELTQYSDEKLIGLKYNIIFKFLKLDKIEAGDTKRQKVVRKDKTKFLADIKIGEEVINGNAKVLLFITDVTEKVKNQQEVVLDLERSEKSKQQLISQEEELKMNMEEMATQEEELRQNLEEMQTTQEELKKNQTIVESNNRKIEAILNNSRNGIIMIDNKSGLIETSNTVIQELTQYSESELLQMNYKSILKFLKIKGLENGTKKRQKIIRKDGSRFLADIYVGIETIDGKKALLLFIEDVTEKVAVQQKIITDYELLKKRIKELEGSNNA